MIIKRNSWHYKMRKSFFEYNEWDIIIENTDSKIVYWTDVIWAITCFWQRNKNKNKNKVIFED